MERLQQTINKVKEIAKARKVTKDREFFAEYFNTMNSSTTGSYSQDIAWHSHLMSDEEIEKIVSILKGEKEHDIKYVMKGNSLSEFHYTVISKKIANAKFVLKFRFNRKPEAQRVEEESLGYTIVYQEDNINTYWYLLYSYKIEIQ